MVVSWSVKRVHSAKGPIVPVRSVRDHRLDWRCGHETSFVDVHRPDRRPVVGSYRKKWPGRCAPLLVYEDKYRIPRKVGGWLAQKNKSPLNCESRP